MQQTEVSANMQPAPSYIDCGEYLDLKVDDGDLNHIELDEVVPDDDHMYEELKPVPHTLGTANSELNSDSSRPRPTLEQAEASPDDTENNKGFCRIPLWWRWGLLGIGLVIVAILIAVLVTFTTGNTTTPTPTPTPTGRINITGPFTTTDTIYRDCQAAYEDGQTESRVYTIKPDAGVQINVYCEMDIDGGGWTVFQRRSDGSEDFYQGWTEYKNGFGNVAGEFWVGNENLYLMTSDHKQKLKIELKYANETAIADYALFWVENETDEYKLHVRGFSRTDPPGDSLLDHNNQSFSTQDLDNDKSTVNCAKLYTGAWWYKSCYESSLNGKYGDLSNTGVVWKSWKGASTSLTNVRMMFKTAKVYRDCLAAYNDGQTRSGVYQISPDGVTRKDVYCEQGVHGGGWTVFQRRMDGTVDFQRTWDEYKRGFGSIDGEYWLGNDIIHLMTVNHDQQLKVELEHGGLTAIADYSEFWINDESAKYQLHIGGFSNGKNSPGDSLVHHNNMFFSTKDRDNDRAAVNRAVTTKGAWWHKDGLTSNLNSLYGDNYNSWYTWTSHTRPMTASRMMIKTK